MSSIREVIFVTGNAGKLREVERMMSNVGGIRLLSHKLDLPELQGAPEEIAREKALIAFEKLQKPVLIEDTSLCFNSLGGLPGPYIKHFLEAVGHEGLNRMLDGFEDRSAYAQCIFAYCDGSGSPRLFVGRSDTLPGATSARRGPSYGHEATGILDGIPSSRCLAEARRLRRWTLQRRMRFHIGVVPLGSWWSISNLCEWTLCVWGHVAEGMYFLGRVVT